MMLRVLFLLCVVSQASCQDSGGFVQPDTAEFNEAEGFGDEGANANNFSNLGLDQLTPGMPSSDQVLQSGNLGLDTSASDNDGGDLAALTLDDPKASMTAEFGSDEPMKEDVVPFTLATAPTATAAVNAPASGQLNFPQVFPVSATARKANKAAVASLQETKPTESKTPSVTAASIAAVKGQAPAPTATQPDESAQGQIKPVSETSDISAVLQAQPPPKVNPISDSPTFTKDQQTDINSVLGSQPAQMNEVGSKARSSKPVPVEPSAPTTKVKPTTPVGHHDKESSGPVDVLKGTKAQILSKILAYESVLVKESATYAKSSLAGKDLTRFGGIENDVKKSEERTIKDLGDLAKLVPSDKVGDVHAKRVNQALKSLLVTYRDLKQKTEAEGHTTGHISNSSKAERAVPQPLELSLEETNVKSVVHTPHTPQEDIAAMIGVPIVGKMDAPSGDMESYNFVQDPQTASPYLRRALLTGDHLTG